jgi:hypothetical protein
MKINENKMIQKLKDIEELYENIEIFKKEYNIKPVMMTITGTENRYYYIEDVIPIINNLKNEINKLKNKNIKT